MSLQSYEEYWATHGIATGPPPEWEEDIVESLKEDDGLPYEEIVFFENGKLVTVRREKKK